MEPGPAAPALPETLNDALALPLPFSPGSKPTWIRSIVKRVGAVFFLPQRLQVALNTTGNSKFPAWQAPWQCISA